MKIDWCKILGHRWRPVVIDIKTDTTNTFLTCFCSRCQMGRKQLDKFIQDTDPDINSYNLDFFQEMPKQNNKGGY